VLGRGVEGFFNRLGCSPTFAKKVSKIAHLSDVPTPIEEYAATATCVEAQVRYLPSF